MYYCLNFIVSIHAPTQGATTSRLPRLGNYGVSIHAPTQGATFGQRPGDNQIRVSIHAPTQGATSAKRLICIGLQCFNPRTHAGCDETSDPLATHILVSIHAPTQGATGGTPDSTDTDTFQSTHPRRVRRFKARKAATMFMFQSTHPRRVRPDIQGYCYNKSLVSIHAPTQGATLL